MFSCDADVHVLVLCARKAMPWTEPSSWPNRRWQREDQQPLLVTSTHIITLRVICWRFSAVVRLDS